MIGVIGLGAMGAPMARNLLGAGKEVVVFDVRIESMNPFAALGAELASSAQDVTDRASLIITMVNDDAALQDVLFGPTGVARAGLREKVLVDLSSTSVQLSRHITEWAAQEGGTYLDGAVIGGGATAAQRGRSPIVVAGKAAQADAVAEELASLGTWINVGAAGNAKITKIINNWLVGAMTASNGEALALGAAQGVDTKTLFESLTAGSGESTVLSSYIGSYLRDGTYGPGLISIPMMEKDMALAIALGDETDAPVISAELTREIYRLASSNVGSDRPFPAVGEFFSSVNR